MQRLLNHSLLLLILFALMAATVSHAFGQNLEGRIEFHGRHYNSLIVAIIGALIMITALRI